MTFTLSHTLTCKESESPQIGWSDEVVYHLLFFFFNTIDFTLRQNDRHSLTQ
jgi:hypothetical protein